MAESALAVLALIQFNIVEEARKDYPVESFIEREMREYKHYLKFVCLKIDVYL